MKKNKKKILIAEDEEDIVFVLKTALEEKDYKVIQAYDGKETLKKVTKEKPDLILLDIMMPGTDGYAINQKLKQSAATKNISVIVITGKPHVREMLGDLKKAGISAYFEKPFMIDDLFKKIKSALK